MHWGLRHHRQPAIVANGGCCANVRGQLTFALQNVEQAVLDDAWAHLDGRLEHSGVELVACDDRQVPSACTEDARIAVRRGRALDLAGQL